MEFEKIPKVEYISVTGWGMGKIHQSAQLCSLGAFGQVTVSEDMMYLLFICSHHGMEWSMAQDYSTEISTLLLFSCSNPEKQFRNQLFFFMPIWYADKNKFTSSSSDSVAAIISSYPLGTTKKKSLLRVQWLSALQLFLSCQIEQRNWWNTSQFHFSTT